MKSNLITYIAFSVIIMLQVVSLTTTDKKIVTAITKVYYKETKKSQPSFNKEELIKYIKQLNIKFPKVVLAQARIESGNFTSKIFKNNNNLFGMKIAKSRPTLAKKSNNAYAKYNNWKESVIDYAIMQAVFYRHCKTEDEYIQQIQKNYCESNNYIQLIKECMK